MAINESAINSTAINAIANVFYDSLTDSLAFSDDYAYAELINERLSFLDSYAPRSVYRLLLDDKASYTDSYAPNSFFEPQLNDKAFFTDSYHPASIYTLSLNDIAAYADFYRTAKTYLGLALNTESHSMTTFENLPFDFSCNFNHKTLFANELGLFEYGGADDEGIPVIASIKTDKSNRMPVQNGMSHSQKLKILPTSHVYINAVAQGEISLTVVTDDESHHYTLNEFHPDFAVFLMNVGRGLRGVHWQLEITGCDKIESIDYELKEIRRRR